MRAPIANEAVAPVVIVREAVRAAQIMAFPAVEASYICQWVAAVQSPVAVGSVMAAALEIVPLVPDDAPVADPCVPSQAAVDRAIAVRA